MFLYLRVTILGLDLPALFGYPSPILDPQLKIGAERMQDFAKQTPLNGAYTIENVDDFIIDAFVTLLGRRPESAALNFYRDGILGRRLSPADMLIQIARTEEFFQHSLLRRDVGVFRLGSLAAKPAAQMEFDSKYEALDFAERFPEDFFLQLFARVTRRELGQEFLDYANLHRRRMRELLGFVDLHSNPTGRLCEISTCAVSPYIKQVFRGTYISADHPSIYSEAAYDKNNALNSDLHIPLDLNRLELSKILTERQIKSFDVILFCEVLEHLLVSPYDTVKDLARCLKPSGRLFISTPNFFSHERLAKMAHRQHPAQIIGEGESFATGAHHVREYEMSELLYVCEKAGLDVIHYSFSACWDRPELLEHFLQRHPYERSCLYVVAARPS